MNALGRREFFGWVWRGGLVTALGWLIGRRVGRVNGDALAGQTCTNRGYCRGCGAYARCGLPAALNARQAGMRPG